MNLTFLWAHGTQIGYARSGTYIAEALQRRGVTIYDDDGRPSEHDPRGSSGKRVTDGRDAAPSPTNAVCWVSVPTHANGWYQGQHRSIITMWEASRLPEGFRDVFPEFDVLMVPSEHNLELFGRYHDNVRLLLLGVDGTRWKYDPPPSVGQTFNFLISGRGPRKGIDLAYEAFQTVFGQWWTTDVDGRAEYRGPADKPWPRLTIKSMRGQGDYYAPGVAHVTGKLTDDEELDLYRSCHAYLQPSRGEGFGLQPLQALALGRPTILTNAHGHASFAHLGTPLSTTMQKAAYFVYGDPGDWWEPNFEELCEAMWATYQDYDGECVRAKEAARVIARGFTWENTTDTFMDIMGDAMSAPYSGNGQWESATRLRYKIVTNQDWYGEIAGRQMFFEKGKVYYDLGDVKRIFFDAGVLSPACLEEDDHGLAFEQIASIPEYNASHSHCPTCQQELNTRPTRADQIMDELDMEEQARLVG